MSDSSIPLIPEMLSNTPLGACLQPLLRQLNWNGDARYFNEALPHLMNVHTPSMFCDVMSNLNFRASSVKAATRNIDSRLLPCLFVLKEGAPLVLLRRDQGQLHAYDSELKKEVILSDLGEKDEELKGRAYFFKVIDKKEKKLKEQGWVRRNFLANRKFIYTALFLSFFINLFMLATPLFIMSVYDKVIGASSYDTLGMFSIGMAIVMAGLFILYHCRAEILALIGARGDHNVGNGIFEKLLYLSPSFTETATVGAQVARLKDFDRLRSFFTGKLFTVMFDMPFILIALTLIAILAGSLVLVPVVMAMLYAIVGLITFKKIKRTSMDAVKSGAEQQEFLIESLTYVRAIKYTNVIERWCGRFRELSAGVMLTSFKTTMINSINSAVSDMIMIGSGMAVLGFGALKVIDGSLSIGAMIAVMMLIWRVLGPIKVFFNTLTSLQQVGSSFGQIGRLFSIPSESDPYDLAHSGRRQLNGDIRFDRVSFRYTSSYNPALMGVNLDISAGQAVGIIGRNGSGKSTILKLTLSLYQPQAGGVRIDNLDVRQFNPIELRNSIGYLPQLPELFYGSIAQNLRLADPTANLEDLKAAAEKAGILEEIEMLPKGFDAQIRDFSRTQMGSSFRQGICLARAYLKNSSILLLDEPANSLDMTGDKKLIETIQSMRGKVTVLMVSHRPSHLKLMDKIIVMDAGQVALEGPPNEVFDKIPKELL